MAKGTLTPKKRVRKRKPKDKSVAELDYRQQQFLASYKDPKSATFGNVRQSALKAGFGKKYADNLTAELPDWLQKNLGIIPALVAAEKNLDEYLKLPSKTQAMGAFGPIFRGKGSNKTPVIVYNAELLKRKWDATKFALEKLGREKYGDEKAKELPPLQTLIIINAPDGTKETRVYSKSEAVPGTSVVGRSENN